MSLITTRRMSNDGKRKVCIIGAGSAGLCAARHVLSYRQQLEFDIYEQTSLIGGTWNYTDQIGEDDNGLPIHSSMYRDLRTNLPMEIMEFPDYPSSCDTSFVHHTEVLSYLHDYAKHFAIDKLIKFQHHIINVSRKDDHWQVIVKDVAKCSTFEVVYDAVIVCNGTYATPKMPRIDGIEKFKGKIIHTHDYRAADTFKGEKALVLGAGPSGIDIALELSEQCVSVVLCHQLNKTFNNLPENIIQDKDTIQSITENGVVMKSGTCYSLDTIVFATGYYLDYKFLNTNCNIKVNDNAQVEGVYLHFINISHPSMAIMGIPCIVIPFVMFHQQLLLFVKSLVGEVKLPSKQEMIEDTEEDLKQRKLMGLPERYSHFMFGQLQWDHHEKVSKIGQIKPIKKVVINIYEECVRLRTLDIAGYKNYNFVIETDSKFRTK